MVRGPKKRLGRPPAVDSDETHQRIIEVAQGCFAERGFQSATNSEIAEKAGLTSGSIYHHFGSKPELFAAVCAHARDLLVQRMHAAAEGTSTFVERLSAVLDVAAQVDEEQPSLAKFFVGALMDARRNPQLAPAVEQWAVGINEFVAEMVRDAVASGELDIVTDEQTLMSLVNVLILGFSTFMSMAPPEQHANVFIEGKRLLDGTLVGIAAPRT